jgi:hypothetical protein
LICNSSPKASSTDCAVTDKHVIEEWLVQVIGGQEKTVYERITDKNGKVKNEARE